MPDRLARLHSHQLRDHVLLGYQGTVASPSDVARQLGRPLNLVAYHTRVLVSEGSLELVRTSRRRGAVVRFYRATVPQALEDHQWSTLPLVLRRRLALETLALVAAEARAGGQHGGFDGARATLVRLPMRLDAEGTAAVSDVLNAAYEAIERIAAEARARGSEEADDVEVALLHFRRAPGSPQV
jgi:hypothetical protein